MRRLLFLINVLVASVVILAFAPRLISTWWPDRSQPPGASTILKTEIVKHLVTKRIVTQTAAHVQTPTIFGTNEIVAYGAVVLSVGIDIEKVVVSELATQDPGISILIPEPEVFSIALDEGSVHVVGKGPWIWSRSTQIDSLIRELLRVKAREFVQDQGLLPTREESELSIRELLKAFGYDDEDIAFVQETG